MVFEKIKSIISEQFDIEESEITLNTDLLNDLNADSLDLADLMSTIEDEFNIEATDEAIAAVNTIEDIVNYISENCANNK